MASVPRGFMEPWARKIEAESEGRIKIELYPSMQLGGAPPALYDQIRDGVIDCGWALPGYTPGRFPATEVFELPFMTSMSAEDTSRAVWEYSMEYVAEQMPGVQLMATHVHGPGVIHTAGSDVTTLGDLEGLKLRGPSRQANALLEALGATPVGIPVPAFPEALSKGVVNGGVIPWEIVPPLKIHELADHHTTIGGDRALYNTFFIWGMNKAVYDGLPDDLRAIIDANSGQDVSAWAGRAMDEGDTIGENIVRERGNTVTTLSDAEVDELRAIGDTQRAAWIVEVTEKGLDGQAMVDRAVELMTEFDQM
jgi:TRAP-type C4-dicarboxylate transport system substrate-binding protein